MRIVLATFGTLGDVNPLIGLALELKRRGHQAVLATPELFRTRIEPLGLGFYPMRPDQDPANKALVAMIYDIKRGTERGLRKFLFPALRESYQDLLHAVTADGGADLLVSGELAYAGPLVAEVTGIRWASYVLAPFSFFSAWDPPVLPPYPGLGRLQTFVPGTGHLVRPFARLVTRAWCEPVYALRRELGLPAGESPLFDAKHAPGLVLALFSRVLGERQPDWPASTRTTGFVFYDGANPDPGHAAHSSTGRHRDAIASASANGHSANRNPATSNLANEALADATFGDKAHASEDPSAFHSTDDALAPPALSPRQSALSQQPAPRLDPQLQTFLDSGPPPLVFTLGSAAVLDAGDFYEQSARAALTVGRRAVLLVGTDPANRPRTHFSPEIFCATYAPFSDLFPRAALIVHQGGVGTTAQALRAGKPMLMMPYSHDQPDNARRMRRLGVASVIERKHYRAATAAPRIARLLADPNCLARAAAAARIIAEEDGLHAACDALEAYAR